MSVVDRSVLRALNPGARKTPGFRSAKNRVQTGIKNRRFLKTVAESQRVGVVESVVDLGVEGVDVFLAHRRFLKVAGKTRLIRWRNQSKNSFGDGADPVVGDDVA